MIFVTEYDVLKILYDSPLHRLRFDEIMSAFPRQAMTVSGFVKTMIDRKLLSGEAEFGSYVKIAPAGYVFLSDVLMSHEKERNLENKELRRFIITTVIGVVSAVASVVAATIGILSIL